MDDLLGIIALESWRNRCLVIGEDLGTVPGGLRERLRDEGIFSYRLLSFEKDDEGAFKPPDDYPPLALVSSGTHDLPTLRGWWTGVDLQLRRALDLFPDVATDAAETEGRQRDREGVLAALNAAGLGVAAPAGAEDWADFAEAVYRYLARDAVEAAARPDRGPLRAGGPGEPARHGRRASQLAAQARRTTSTRCWTTRLPAA